MRPKKTCFDTKPVASISNNTKKKSPIYLGLEKFGKTKLIRPAESAINNLDGLNLIDLLENGNSARIHPIFK